MRNKIAVFFWAILAGPLAAAPAFSPVTVPTQIYSGGWEFFVGGGIATFDCNGDHLPDLFVAGGANPAMLLRNISKPGEALKFADDTPINLRLRQVTGAYPLDIDSDGIRDLVVLRVGRNLLLKGLGNCRFRPFETLNFLSGDRWTAAFSATWEPRQTLPTLAIGNYVDRTDPKGPFGACDKNFLYRPNGGKYTTPINLAPAYCPLSMLFSDWGRNGRADLRISNDRHYYVSNGQEQLWAMAPSPRLYGPNDGWKPYMLWGMGIASRDISGDGRPEIFLSSMGDQKLQSLETDATGPTYIDATFGRGTTAHRPYTGGDGRPSTGWQISFGDVQNDGRDDVFIAKGNVDQMPGSAMDDPNNLLIQQPNGKFVETGKIAGIASMARGRGAVLADLNLDGLLDLGVVNRRAPLEVYQNVSNPSGNWLAVQLRQPAPNINAVGAWIELDTGQRKVAREITVGGGHASGVSGPEHFGLGGKKAVKLRVIWPDQSRSKWVLLKANQMLTVFRSGDNLRAVPY